MAPVTPSVSGRLKSS